MGAKGRKEHRYNDGWIAENFFRYPNTKIMCDAYNEKFNVNLNYRQLSEHCRNKGLKRDIPCGNAFKYNDEWLRANRDKYKRNAELRKAYIAEFGKCVTKNAFNTHLRNIGLSAGNNTFTEEQDEWLKENYPILSRKECTEKFNEIFSDTRTEGVIKARATQYLKVKVDGRKKGERASMRSCPVGTETTHKNGVTYIKVKRERGSHFYSTYIPKARYIYELAYGEIPKGSQIVHLDGNLKNFELDNLACISKGDSAIMTANKLWSKGKEITRTGVKWVNLYKVVRDRKHGEV